MATPTTNPHAPKALKALKTSSSIIYSQLYRPSLRVIDSISPPVLALGLLIIDCYLGKIVYTLLILDPASIRLTSTWYDLIYSINTWQVAVLEIIFMTVLIRTIYQVEQYHRQLEKGKPTELPHHLQWIKKGSGGTSLRKENARLARRLKELDEEDGGLEAVWDMLDRELEAERYESGRVDEGMQLSREDRETIDKGAHMASGEAETVETMWEMI